MLRGLWMSKKRQKRPELGASEKNECILAGRHSNSRLAVNAGQRQASIDKCTLDELVVNGRVLRTNNHHNATKWINLRIRLRGYSLEKYPLDGYSRSGAWFIVRVQEVAR